MYEQFYSMISNLEQYFHVASNDDIIKHVPNEKKIAMRRNETGRVIIGSVNLQHSMLRAEYSDHYRGVHHILSQTKLLRIFAYETKQKTMTKFNIIYDSVSTMSRNSSYAKERVAENLQTLDRKWRVYRYPLVDDIVGMVQTRIFENMIPKEAIELLTMSSKQKLTVIHRGRGNKIFQNTVFYRIALFENGRQWTYR